MCFWFILYSTGHFLMPKKGVGGTVRRFPQRSPLFKDYERWLFPILAQFIYKTPCFSLILTFSTYTVEKSQYGLHSDFSKPQTADFLSGATGEKIPLSGAPFSLHQYWTQICPRGSRTRWQSAVWSSAWPTCPGTDAQSPRALLLSPHQPHPLMDFTVMFLNSANNSSYINTYTWPLP